LLPAGLLNLSQFVFHYSEILSWLKLAAESGDMGVVFIAG
jgi:hypothetical protein